MDGDVPSILNLAIASEGTFSVLETVYVNRSWELEIDSLKNMHVLLGLPWWSSG